MKPGSAALSAKSRMSLVRCARKVVTEGKSVKAEINAAQRQRFLGVLKFREFWLEKHNEIGLTTGLAWTEVGGSVLPPKPR
jgi:ATP-dependent Lon protease